MKRKVLLALLICAALLLAACGGRDDPPDDGTPSPPAHEGRFVCEYGAMTFAGDGRNVVCEFDESFASLTGLPAGKSEASYVFLFGGGEWRYDKAEYFRLTVNGESALFANAFGITDENRIAFRAESGETVIFEKEDTQ